MSSWFQWVLGLHIVAFVFWLSAMFSLSGLLIYHAAAAKEDDQRGCERFSVMEQRLFRGVMNPAMIGTIIFGILLIALNTTVLGRGWFYIKAALVVILIGYHHMGLAHIKKLAAHKGRGPLYYRVFALVPALLMLAIVGLSILRPY